MFLIRRPSAQEIERFLAASRELPLSYEPVGLARTSAAGFSLDERKETLGLQARFRTDSLAAMRRAVGTDA